MCRYISYRPSQPADYRSDAARRAVNEQLDTFAACAGGGGDADADYFQGLAKLGIVSREGERVVVDVIRGRKPPFDPATVAAEFAALARDYRCARITGDNFAAEWVAGALTKAGLPYVRSDAPRSEIYLACLALWMRGIVSIPNHTQMVRELRLLERRTHRSGRDSVDHGAHGSDDYANALSGALRLAAGKRQPLVIPQAAMERAARKPVRWPTIGPGPRLHLNW